VFPPRAAHGCADRARFLPGWSGRARIACAARVVLSGGTSGPSTLGRQQKRQRDVGLLHVALRARELPLGSRQLQLGFGESLVLASPALARACDASRFSLALSSLRCAEASTFFGGQAPA